MQKPKYDGYQTPKPYFDFGSGALVDGEHFFEIVADDIVYDVLYAVGGWIASSVNSA